MQWGMPKMALAGILCHHGGTAIGGLRALCSRGDSNSGTAVCSLAMQQGAQGVTSRNRASFPPQKKKNITLGLPLGSRSHRRERRSMEDRTIRHVRCSFFTGRAAVTAISPACGEVRSAPSSPPFLGSPPPSKSGKVGSLELVQLCKQDHGGEQTARHIRELKEKGQVLLSLFNVQDQYLCNIRVIGLNICNRIKYFCTALVTSLASSAWGCW